MINVGIIGMGRSGWELHATHLSRIDGYRVVAVCDQNEKRVKEAGQVFGARPYMETKELLADREVQLAVAAVPVNLHAAVTVAALEAGKDVVVEKPMAVNLDEVDRMIAAAKRSGRTLAVFHNRRWDRDYQTVRSLVQKGELGEPLVIESRVMTYGPEWANYGVPEFNPQWRLKAAYGGGFLGDWGPHLVEQLLDLTGELPVSLTGQLRSHLWATEVEDYFHIRLTFPSGLLATVEGSNNARLPLPRWLVVGRKGTLTARGEWGRWTEMLIRKAVDGLDGLTVDLIPQNVGPSSGSRNYDVGEELSVFFYNDLAEALKTGREPAVTLKRVRDVMLILEAARESSARGQTVTLNYSAKGRL